MRRILISCFLLVVISLLAFPVKVSAGLVTIREDGEVVLNVLSETDEIKLGIAKPSEVEVEKIAGASATKETTVVLKKDDNNVTVSVGGGGVDRQYSLADTNESLVVINERPQVNTLSIGYVDGKFSLSQGEAVALTDYPITIEPKSARILVSTDRGEQVVSVLPSQAVESLAKARILSGVKRKSINLMEKDSQVAYFVEGEKNINLFDLVSVPVELKAYVSASTGEIITIDAPVWYKVLGFLFA